MAIYDPQTQRYPAIPAWLIVDEDGRNFAPLGFPTRNDPDRDFAWSEVNLVEVELCILRLAGSVAEMAGAKGLDVAQMTSQLSAVPPARSGSSSTAVFASRL